MRHLIDEREPITLQEIEQAQADARVFLTADDDTIERFDIENLVRRLAAIADYTYGPLEVPERYRPTPEDVPAAVRLDENIPQALRRRS